MRYTTFSVSFCFCSILQILIPTLNFIVTRLLAAEEAVLTRGGNVIRLAGLYNATRGPHSYWLSQAAKLKTTAPSGAISTSYVIDSSADSVLNLLHYEDAAKAVLALVSSKAGSSLNMYTLLFVFFHL